MPARGLALVCVCVCVCTVCILVCSAYMCKLVVAVVYELEVIDIRCSPSNASKFVNFIINSSNN